MDINLPLQPPVNNNTQGNIYDKLDALAFEKIRVANSQLDARLSIQERIITKYRRDAEKVHNNQYQKLRREVRKIREKKPDYVYDDSDISSKKASETGRTRAVSETGNVSYCRRYYSHHYQLKDESKKSKKDKDKRPAETDFFNNKLRVFFLNSMNYIQSQSLLNEKEAESFEGTDDHCRFPHLAIKSEDKRSEEVVDRVEHNVSEDIDKDKHSVVADGEDDVFEDELKVSEQEDSPNATEVLQDESTSEVRENRDMVRHRDVRRRSRQKRSRKSISESSEENGKDQWRRTKYAFEKIFAGLL